MDDRAARIHELVVDVCSDSLPAVLGEWPREESSPGEASLRLARAELLACVDATVDDDAADAAGDVVAEIDAALASSAEVTRTAA